MKIMTKALSNNDSKHVHVHAIRMVQKVLFIDHIFKWIYNEHNCLIQCLTGIYSNDEYVFNLLSNCFDSWFCLLN